MKSLDLVLLLIVLASAKSDVCQDGSLCAEGETCCPTGSGHSCCPYRDGVCCSDLEYCCPENHICLAELNVCVKFSSAKGEHFYTKYKALRKPMKLSQPNVCPGGQEKCPEGKTCCPVQGGTFGCCQMPNAVCCADKIHCCPEGHTCDATGKCIGENLKFLKNIPLTTEYEDIICPDGGQCQNNFTCCVMASGEYGCCPFPQAVCCSDKLHCCPHGMTCDLVHQTCTRSDGAVAVPWSRKFPGFIGE